MRDRLPVPDSDRSTILGAIRHYADCAPGLCEESVADVVHREVPEHFTPEGDGDPARPSVTWALEQHDEIRHGEQVAHEPTAVFTWEGDQECPNCEHQVPAQRLELTMPELWTCIRDMITLYSRGNMRADEIDREQGRKAS